MPNYRSALNGQQMDDALMDVALRNSEAWAVGQRNGIPVTSADETYHNNAKYYAQVAQSAIPGTYTAAVRWDIAQGLAGEAQEQARANISAGASNRNLLDNPWFTNPVNQRGETSYAKTSSAAIYTLDRWLLLGASPNKITVNSGYISVASGNNGFAQYIPTELGAELNGKTVTLSVMDYLGRVSSGTLVYSNTTLVNVTGVQVDGKGCNLYCGALSGKQLGFSITTGTGNTVRIKAVKLELGAYSTLVNDVPPKKRSTLADCQERFLRVKSDTTVGVVGFGSQTQSDRAYILIPTPVTMELNASNTMSVSLTGTARLVGNGSGSITVTSVSFVSKEANGVLIACFGSNIAANVTYNLYLTSGSHIDISGDL